MGSCVAGGAYLPIMSDEALIVDKTGSIFFSRKLFSKAAIGKILTMKPLVGQLLTVKFQGLLILKQKDDKDALDRIKNIVSKMGDF